MIWSWSSWYNKSNNSALIKVKRSVMPRWTLFCVNETKQKRLYKCCKIWLVSETLEKPIQGVFFIDLSDLNTLFSLSNCFNHTPSWSAITSDNIMTILKYRNFYTFYSLLTVYFSRLPWLSSVLLRVQSFRTNASSFVPASHPPLHFVLEVQPF